MEKCIVMSKISTCLKRTVIQKQQNLGQWKSAHSNWAYWRQFQSEHIPVLWYRVRLHHQPNLGCWGFNHLWSLLDIFGKFCFHRQQTSVASFSSGMVQLHALVTFDAQLSICGFLTGVLEGEHCFLGRWEVQICLQCLLMSELNWNIIHCM